MTPHRFSYPRVVSLNSGPSARRGDAKRTVKVEPNLPAKPRVRRSANR